MSLSSTPRRGLRRLLTAALATALMGAGAFGVQTLRAAPASVCDDPIATCALGPAQCAACCAEQGESGTCDIAPGVCLCFS